ncbi:PTS sugar transporter subunit IIA [Leptotrichia sp. oral taxon 847]|uniref:PTS sugar transporter subunit IIA n=1 Tax=Leptotrichia sp. oral taxon 847 TaxID=1785996 RepID=UPI0007681B9A|nr:PTS sugar transporter subunit IIA [Leptotrichia sp. oral taxon 847]AMD94310.1 PTS sugar transporter subunit IIA [Leptotrichia sp. oral taxon 847]
MKIVEYLSENRVKLDLKGKNKEEVIREMAQVFVKDGILSSDDVDEFITSIYEREKLSSTGMQDGLAIPHTRTALIKKMSLALGVSKNGVDFDSMDGEPSKLIFMIAAPEDAKGEHLDLLAEISKLSFEEEILEKIETAKTAKEVLNLLN